MPRDFTELMIKEVIVVEGRDDSSRIKEALRADTYETGGFGYSKEVLEELGKIYESRGLIIFTDPDYGGNKIRKDLKAHFPQAKEARISMKESLKDGDMGIENASLEVIQRAIDQAGPTYMEVEDSYSNMDMIAYGLTGRQDSKERRAYLAQALGIPMSNARAFLQALKTYKIPRSSLEKELDKFDKL